MNPKILVATGISLVVFFILLGAASILPWQAAGTLTATTIGIVGMILALGGREASQKPQLQVRTNASSTEEGRLLWEETIMVEKNGCSYYQLNMTPNEKIIGEISSKDYFNAYFLTSRNNAKRAKGENFDYEYGTEHASRMRVDFIPKRAGKYFIVIESHATADIEVNVKLRIDNVKKLTA